MDKPGTDLRSAAGWDIFTDAPECAEQVAECIGVMEDASWRMDALTDVISNIIASSDAGNHDSLMNAIQDAKRCLQAGSTERAPAVASHWDNHPDFPVEDWQAEVANGDTRQSYREWCQSQEDLAAGDPE